MVASAGGAKVLVVEDEHLVALDIERRLVGLGYHVANASAGEEAVQTAAEAQPDVVLMDIRLGGEMDGIEAARRIREMLDIPVVYLTAHADRNTVERAKATEPFGYIVKPFEEQQLKVALEVAFHRHRAERNAKDQEKRQRFIAQASAVLSSSLEHEGMIQATAMLLVPQRADWCLIQLEGSDDELCRFAVVHSVGSMQAKHLAPTRPLGSILDTVIRTGTRQLISGVTDPAWWSNALGPEYAEELRETGAQSLLCVPLEARRRVLGAIAVAFGRAHRLNGPLDLRLIEDLAHRLAISIDNALLFEKVQRAVRMRDDVLAIVSHDLRSPLGVIMLIAEQLAAAPPCQHQGQGILRATHRMRRLIDDLLDTASIDAGRLSIERGSHRAAELVAEALDAHRSEAAEASIVLVDEVPKLAPRIACDRDRTVQTLSNLIGNALKFGSRGGSVNVGAERRESYLCFSVSDTGAGISPDDLPHLFDRFWRAAPSSRQGSGLGLYIAKGIVEAQGGRIWAEINVGVGSTFFFTVPLAV